MDLDQLIRKVKLIEDTHRKWVNIQQTRKHIGQQLLPNIGNVKYQEEQVEICDNIIKQLTEKKENNAKIKKINKESLLEIINQDNKTNKEIFENLFILYKRIKFINEECPLDEVLRMLSLISDAGYSIIKNEKT
jgi:hypothetical protein